MGTATSASRVCRAPASASLCTATERMPISRSVRITRTAISPRLATRTVSNMRGPLHPEDAVADVFEGRVGAGGQGEAEHGAGLGGVDHAVVPEPGGGVVRMTLVLVLLPDRRLERLLLLGGP